MVDVGRVGQTIYERAVMLDTGPLISLYDPRDSRGEQVSTTLQQVQKLKYPVCVTLLTIAEAHRGILYNVGYEHALEFLKAICDGSVHIVPIEEKDINNAINIIGRYSDQDISYTDAVSMSVMKRMGIYKVLSYDHHFWVLNFYIPPEIYSLH